MRRRDPSQDVAPGGSPLILGAVIRIQRLSKAYGSTLVLDGLDLAVETREVLAVVGPSGAGKSTLAQCVTLLERPTSGQVIVNGEDLTALGSRHLQAARRRIGTIFQSDGLFARRTAAENVALPLEYLGVTRAETRGRVAELLDRVGLSDKAKRYPHELSGGQRQRVGIARALALRPTVLLSDEATSGLDPQSTASILALLRELRDDLGLSILFITHEMEAVIRVADRVARLDHGRILEQGAIGDLLRDPASELGAQLRRTPTPLGAEDGDQVWVVEYTTSAVPRDWITRVGDDLGAPVGLLGAWVEGVDGAAVGNATIALPASVVEVERTLGRYGLRGRRADAGPTPARTPFEPVDAPAGEELVA
jgi:ABC-type methionine transport system ATPase subunit